MKLLKAKGNYEEPWKSSLSQFNRLKINMFTFTIYNLQNKTCKCCVCDDSQGHRGANVLGTVF